MSACRLQLASSLSDTSEGLSACTLYMLLHKLDHDFWRLGTDTNASTLGLRIVNNFGYVTTVARVRSFAIPVSLLCSALHHVVPVTNGLLTSVASPPVLQYTYRVALSFEFS